MYIYITLENLRFLCVCVCIYIYAYCWSLYSVDTAERRLFQEPK